MTRVAAVASNPTLNSDLGELPINDTLAQLLSGFDQDVADIVNNPELETSTFAATAGQAPAADPTSARHKAKHHGGGTDFNMASFNVLGASHTQPGGEKPTRASGVKRMHAAAVAIGAIPDKNGKRRPHVDVVGFQELQHPQLREFQRLTHGKYGVYPGFKGAHGDTENSIAWDKSKFKLVHKRTIDIPYFNGHKRQMPIVVLQNKQTGQKMVFTNFHNPADTHRFHHQEKYRDQATRIEIAMVKRLEKRTGLPVFVTGDMNESSEYFNKMTGQTNMHAAHKGKQVGIDHIYGSPQVQFSHFNREHNSLIKFASDHPLIFSHVHIKG